MAGLPDDSGLLFLFFYFFSSFAMPVAMIPFSRIMRLYLKSEFIVSSLNACHMLLCIPHSYLMHSNDH